MNGIKNGIMYSEDIINNDGSFLVTLDTFYEKFKSKPPFLQYNSPPPLSQITGKTCQRQNTPSP